MGAIKTLHHLLPWYCLHLPCTTTVASSPPTSTTAPNAIRLIASDGCVKTLEAPLRAWDLMRQHPLHLVCSADSLFIGQKIPALSASDHLQPGHSYFLLPSHLFHQVLSFVSLSSSLVNLRSQNSKPSLRHFDIQKTDKGMLQVRVKDVLDSDKLSSMLEDGGGSGGDEGACLSRLCSSRELEREYRQLVRRRWKPRLEAITESANGRKSSVMLVSLSSFRRRKKKMQQQQ